MKIISIVLVLLSFCCPIYNTNTSQTKSELYEAVPFDEVKEYFFKCLNDVEGIYFDNNDQYCLRAKYYTRYRTGDKFYSILLDFYDDETETRKQIGADVLVNLQPFDIGKEISNSDKGGSIINIRGKMIEFSSISQEAYPRKLWEKEKTMLQAMKDWYDPRKTMPLWEYTQKSEFFKQYGGFPGDASFGIYDYHYPGITKPTAIVDTPKEGEMQYEEALEIAWQMFYEHSDYTGDPNNLKISSICLRLDEEAIKSWQARDPLAPDDGIRWMLQFYEPVHFDNGETVYEMIFETGTITRYKKSSGWNDIQ